MKIGISGASGQLGRAAVRHLAKRVNPADLVGISRTPEKVAALGINARPGDFDHPESLDRAFAGLDRLLIIPTADLRPGIRGAQGTAAIERAAAAGVKHIVLMSSLGTKLEPAPHLWESYFVTEQALMRCRVTWTIVRMAYYAEALVDEVRAGLARGVHAGTSSTPVNFVSRGDVAATAAAVLASECHAGAIYQATGPEAFGGDARAAVIASALGRPFPFFQISREQYAEGLQAAGLPPFVIDAVLCIQDMWKVGGFHVTTGDVERLTGTAPRSLAEVLAAAFATR